MAAQGDVEADLGFLQRIDLYETEKPYTLQYFPDDESFPRTNCATARRSKIKLRDLRAHEKEPTIDTEGFEILQLDSAMQYADFGSTETIQHKYYPEIKTLLQAHFQPQRIEILEHNIRKRHRTFPIATGTDYHDLQPTTRVHVDYTESSMVEAAYKYLDVRADQFDRIVALNVWRTLKGPLMDWPLAMCSAKTVDYATDLIACDLVNRTSYSENMQVHYNANHEWWYLSGQLTSELLVFRQADTSREQVAGVPHTGFKHPKTTDQDHPRESIELRAFLFF
ncbi:uncharacterized protein AB675_1585 [Cyphellophora attinorum]|uniref:Methyltransferase n=1 Tax=Cyphellophora attinorum TaxID=1664694 RepID=A0A0N1HKJ1_9EURO|nr:uncharacterized protein AB675_1585 [Phialophora attinorum]KPI37285.1 hypothetical protein AB675_1585 [Phialophora attinorum]